MNFKKQFFVAAVSSLALASTVVGSDSYIKTNIFVNETTVYAADSTYGSFNYTLGNDNTVTITKYNGTDASVTIPSSINGYKVTVVGERAFWNNTSLTTIKFNSNIKTIGSSAFQGCSNLSSVTISSNITAIEAYAFSSCSKLSQITIPAKVKTIGNQAFDNCTNLKNVTISYGVESIGNYVFENCTSLISVSLPNSLTSIGNSTFKNCGSLTSITIPSSISSIPSSLFQDCKNLTSITIPSNIKTIEKSAFLGCTNLSSVTLNNGLTDIKDSAFYDCDNLRSIKFPSTLKTIGKQSFEESGLSNKLTIPANITSISDEAFRCSQISELYISGTTTIGESAFADCSNLTTVSMLNGPKIENQGFYNCTNLTNINVNINLNISWHDSTFSNCPKLEKINNKTVTYVNYKIGAPYFEAEFKDFVYDHFRDVNNVGFINRYVSNQVKYIVNTYTTSDMTDIEKAKVLHDWICNKVDYDHGNESDKKNHVDSSIFLNDTTVCDGYARGYELLLQEAGIEVSQAGNIDHVWNVIKIDNHYFHVDVCWDDGRWDETNGNWDWFLKSDSELIVAGGSHSSWSSSAPKCNYRLGDIDKDGMVESSDSEHILRHTAKIKDSIIPEEDFILADINFDGEVDILDVVKLNKQIINEANPVSIISQPMNAAGTEYTTIKTEVVASGSIQKYEWYERKPNQETFTINNKYKESNYELKITPYSDGTEVYCIIRDIYGNYVKTDTATFYVGDPVKITKQPTNASALLNTTVKTTVTATGDSLTYQWYYCNPGSTTFNKSAIKTRTYSCTMSSASNGRKVYCVITDKYGITQTTNTVTLSKGNSVKITKQPTNATAPNGSVVKTTVTATGDSLTYQWYYCNPGSTTFNKSSIKTKTYSCTMSSASNGRKVYCVITDKYGKTAKTNTVTLSQSD